MQENVKVHLKNLMNQILKVRFSDLELEKKYCDELLEAAGKDGDTYATAFAIVHLGDYYVAKNDGVYCYRYLAEGLAMSLQYGYSDLVLTTDILFGIYFEIIGDEHSAVEYHLKGLRLAVQLGDQIAECKILNNMGHDFQKYANSTDALLYCEKAFHILKQRTLVSEEEYMLMEVVIGNLVELYAGTENPGAARGYCEYQQTLEAQTIYHHIFLYKNWSTYHTALGDTEKAIAAAWKVREAGNLILEFNYSIFEIWVLMCRNMIYSGSRELAEYFLNLLLQYDYDVETGNAILVQSLKMDMWLRFCDEEGQEHAYFEYYEKMHEITKKNDKVRVEGLKSQIYLHEIMKEQKDMEQMKSDLMKEANMDELTNLYNRRGFNRLKGKYAVKSDIKSMGFILLDVDCFKEYNDLYGHICGDKVLQEIADCLIMYRPSQLVVSRYGGDEFICMCIDMTDEEIEEFLNKVRDRLYHLNLVHMASVCSNRVTLSIGYSNEDTAAGVQQYELFEIADRALYKSKIKGRNTFTKESANHNTIG